MTLSELLSRLWHRLAGWLRGSGQCRCREVGDQVKLLDNSVFLPLVCELIGEGHTVSIRARGNSMRPFIENDRDVVVLGKADSFKEGDVVLAEVVPGRFILHRIDAIQGEEVRLRGDGNYPGTEHCKMSNLRALMVQVVRKGRTWSTNGMFWRIYSWLWIRCLPARRYLLALYRLLWLHELPARIKNVFGHKHLRWVQ